MGFNCGIVGLPNVGKSTIFNALTNGDADVSSYSFTTSKSNPGVVVVPDKRLLDIDSVISAKKIVNTTMEVVDMPGLASGASQGEGMGNKFLESIRRVDAILHVVRCFEDDDVIHPDGSVNPLRDVETVNSELIMSDLELVTKQLERLQKLLRSGDKSAKKKEIVLNKIQAHLYEERLLKDLYLGDDEKKAISDIGLITFKPVLYIANISEDEIENESEAIKKLRKYVEKMGDKLITICGQIEAEIVQLEPEERDEFLDEMGLKESGLDKLINEGYSLLNLITFFTVGGKENRAWTISKGTTAHIAAGKIHSDIQRGFIRAEVYHVDHLLEYGSEVVIKEKGLFRLEGKDYLVKDGDILHFRFNV